MSEEQVELKAYDVHVLLKRLEGHGIALANGASHLLIEEVFKWVSESAKISATPFDDIAIPVIEKIKVQALAKIDEVLPPPSGAV